MTCYIDPNKCLSWDALLPYVHPYVHGAPDEVILQAIRAATIEFCRRSGILHDENIFDIQSGVPDYKLETLCDYEIVRVNEVCFENRWIIEPSLRKPTRDFCLGYTGLNYPYYYCGPYSFYMQQPNTILLSQSPQEDCKQGLRVEFTVQPKQDGCALDNYLYESWAEGIAYGAIARVSMMPNTPWFSLPVSQQYQIKYRSELARARTAMDLNFTSGIAKMRTERFI